MFDDSGIDEFLSDGNEMVFVSEMAFVCRGTCDGDGFPLLFNLEKKFSSWSVVMLPYGRLSNI